VTAMPTAVWTGTLSFGLVAIPVRLVPATEPKDVRFHLYDREGRRVRQRRVVEGATANGEHAAGETEPPEARDREAVVADAERPIAWEHLTRGHETEEGALVLVTHEEIERLRPQRSRRGEASWSADTIQGHRQHLRDAHSGRGRSPCLRRPS
jgi:DNA end-binding protein Ku